MKKLFAVVLVSIMVISMLTGCSSSGSSNKDSKKSSKEVESTNKKVLKVGMEASYPPFEYREDEEIVGLDVDLAKELGKELGYELEFVDTSFDGIFAGLDKGDYDVIISAITITPDRVKKYSFSTPYIKNYQCIVTLADAKTKPKKLEELKGLEVGYQESSTSDVYVTDNIEAGKIKCSVKEYSKIIDTFSDLKTKRLDAIVCDSTVAEQYIADGKYEITWKQEDEPEEFGICFPKDSELVDDFNKALKKLEKNGKLDEILSTYFAAEDK